MNADRPTLRALLWYFAAALLCLTRTGPLYKEVPDAELREILCSCSDAHAVLPMLTKRYLDSDARDNVGMVYVYDSTAIQKRA